MVKFYTGQPPHSPQKNPKYATELLQAIETRLCKDTVKFSDNSNYNFCVFRECYKRINGSLKAFICL